MSHSYVRSKIRQWCNEVSVATGIPFHETVNTRVKPTDPVWFTVDFTAEFYEGTFCRADFIESGFVRVTCLSPPGVGDGQGVAAIEQIAQALYAKQDARLTLIDFEPADEASLGTADANYRLSVILNYRLSM